MSKAPLKSPIPLPPKGFGLSRRLMVAISIVIVLVMLLFLGFLKHYTPHQHATGKGNSDIIINSESSEAMIAKIQSVSHQPLLVNFPDKRTDRHSSGQENTNSDTLPAELPPSDFKAGSNAQISVYHRNPPPITSTDSTKTSHGFDVSTTGSSFE